MSLSRVIIAHFDGCCEPKNPGGNMGMGAHVTIDNKEVFKHSSFQPQGPSNSNNVAEYLAFEALLLYFLEEGITSELITIYGDSKLVINQMNDEWCMRGGFYVPIGKRCIEHLKLFHRRPVLKWVGRFHNSYADKLSKAQLVKNNINFRLQKMDFKERIELTNLAVKENL